MSSQGLIKKFPEHGGGACTYAVDSSYTVPPIEVAGGYIWIIQVAEIVMGVKCNTPPTLKAYVSYHRDRDLAGVQAKVHERNALLKALKDKKNGQMEFDIAIVDGEILTRYGEEEDSSLPSEARELVKKAEELTREALDLAWETDTPLIGVLKRSYSGDIRIIHELFDIGLSDRVIASIVLDHGEYFTIGTYKEFYDEFNRKIREILDKVSDENIASRIQARYEWIGRIIRAYKGYVGRVKVVFYKPALKTINLAVKTEIAEAPSWSVEKIVSALSGITGSTGFPLPLDYVDQLSYVKYDTRRLVYELVYSKLSQKDMELARLLLSLVNPQKPV
ncbi:DNA double-strand break repair nuclease NurA [Thermosphaera chiliense]|uniref:DNA double-strand break repair nuclease NurA n=1 Tax=Thermosphaera chiliense TaxID=3402707 RepID=A0A7M1UT15_9CREN|nr:DNA double-strand break repair nuclease NurA [Thermosphaera aggregans]QOR94663.1 DNA double-strand break repair nuclease NurA [Thermosphaera aggregans]